jgi:hypothetical protein
MAREREIVMGALMEALRPFAEARMAVVAALRRVDALHVLRPSDGGVAG